MWRRFADWALPPGTLTHKAPLDGYRPPAPAGYVWMLKWSSKPALGPFPHRERGQYAVSVEDRRWFELCPWPPKPPPAPKRRRCHCCD